MARRESFGSIVTDLAHVVSRLPPAWAVILGGAFFLFFYFLLPSWIDGRISSLDGNQFQAIAAARFHYVVKASHWAGIACALVGLYFGVRNTLNPVRSRRSENGLVATLAKLFGRGLD